ncbi:hypothetical protein ROZALSC1DRAFT_10653 [Rozella allomycis CSF55]|uniref:CWF21 domain-containing protein n=1 Tax=Rozella allomycis (strain CSF55) TaxID=988480 RepID=A0A4P9YRQ8_ROZAC|nr:hypothetical protein ROZALSC1DRAFT_10653 [Rozella allomycis CSF55]
MYNGIGLPTPRGSGTNGYIQRNLSHIKTKQSKVNYDEHSEAPRLYRKVDQGILEHQRKRQVEVKCMELRLELQEKGMYSEEQIEEFVDARRKELQKEEMTHEIDPRE